MPVTLYRYVEIDVTAERPRRGLLFGGGKKGVPVESVAWSRGWQGSLLAVDLKGPHGAGRGRSRDAPAHAGSGPFTCAQCGAVKRKRGKAGCRGVAPPMGNVTATRRPARFLRGASLCRSWYRAGLF
jgi:hypothetical protein